MMLPHKETNFATVEVTVAFVDLAGYSMLTEVCADQEAARLAARLADLTRTALQPGVKLVKTIGDAVMVAADTPTHMMATIIDLAARVAGENGFLAIRAGIHHGPAIARGGDYFGHAVNIAARITALAGAGHAVLTDEITEAAAELGLSTTPMGAPALRNITTPIPLHTVALAAARYPRDPVCGTRIDPATAPAHRRHEDREWWFCSTDWAHRYTTTPSLYMPSPSVTVGGRP
ncbi:adenylate/guanylate cyclase domain-containing protein [Mycolicibacterium goodii]|uniref:Guanylyl cyclase n=1 Tax=Mycolicibacterium goodii TaxID=134601 RepID=A0ABS6HJ93_MYCGD|nr:adenylate/guanylate cyclase domain-containing protein [Mycolicibacterium goodii]MBU8822748.1 guanylyl cyclase [Mycolicibacterium goodii]MBU8838842.1 guanylyl cyclase [Mycolicibacterium goodii]